MPACQLSSSGTWAAKDGQPSRNWAEGSGREQVSPVVRVEAMRCADFGPLFVRRAAFLEIGGFNESVLGAEI